MQRVFSDAPVFRDVPEIFRAWFSTIFQKGFIDFAKNVDDASEMFWRFYTDEFEHVQWFSFRRKSMFVLIVKSVSEKSLVFGNKSVFINEHLIAIQENIDYLFRTNGFPTTWLYEIQQASNARICDKAKTQMDRIRLPTWP